jgi:nucleoside phosphorylase
MRLVFVAAEPMEFRGILARASNVRSTAVRGRFAREVRIGGHDALLIANGMGPTRAAAAMGVAGAYRPDAVVSTGFCGALDDRLGIGDIIAATSVAGAGREFPARPVAAPHHGLVVSIDHVAQTAAEKAKLRATGAIAVEMEASAVAAGAQALGLPFYCVRVITDLSRETMSNDFNGALREDGHLDTMVILRGALCRPASRLPELLRLRRRCVRAAEALGEFFAGCRF